MRNGLNSAYTPFEVPEANLDDVLASVARHYPHMSHLRPGQIAV